MTSRQLLRLYPRAWRDRYGDEFVDMVGAEPLQLQQIIDMVCGAIDAWLSADVRGATRAAAHGHGGGSMLKELAICGRNQSKYTTRDGLIGAAVILAGSLLSVLIGGALKRRGMDEAAESVMANGYLVAMNLSMPFWLMKGQPRRAQAVILGGTTAILVAIGVINAL